MSSKKGKNFHAKALKLFFLTAFGFFYIIGPAPFNIKYLYFMHIYAQKAWICPAKAAAGCK